MAQANGGWRGKVVLITGASSGIGAELARQLAANGARVGLTARRQELLEQIVGAIRNAGGIAACAPADALNHHATRRAITQLASDLGPVDTLIANAGLGNTTRASRFSADAINTIVQVNLVGAAVAIEAVLPAMLERCSGQIVGISSLAGYRGLPGSSGYCASKAGLTAMLEAMRVELRGAGVSVTTVHPGFVRTPMIAERKQPTPFAIDVEPAARIILRGIAAGKREINFPWTMAGVMRIARALPNPIYDRIITRVLR